MTLPVALPRMYLGLRARLPSPPSVRKLRHISPTIPWETCSSRPSPSPYIFNVVIVAFFINRNLQYQTLTRKKARAPSYGYFTSAVQTEQKSPSLVYSMEFTLNHNVPNETFPTLFTFSRSLPEMIGKIMNAILNMCSTHRTKGATRPIYSEAPNVV